MITIENSNIVDWDSYPEYICAIVMVSNRDVKTVGGFVMPTGEEIIWLLDKSPSIEGDTISLDNMNINCLGGFGVFGGCDIDFLDVKEIHFKPKPIIELRKQSGVFA